MPVLEKNSVTLAFENLPYLEAFPDEAEMEDILGRINSPFVGSWFDTGHDRVREVHGWKSDPGKTPRQPVGMHLNDVEKYNDDHYAPGGGKVDFAALEPIAKGARHIVFEPGAGVTEEELAEGISRIRAIWRF